MNINLNKIEPNVLCQFQKYETDDGVWLIRFRNDKPANVIIKGVDVDYKGNQSIFVNVGRENREIDAIVGIIRSSPNYYTVHGFYKGKTKIKKCASTEDVSNFIKLNFCKNLIQ